jgi:hypothetical protein
MTIRRVKSYTSQVGFVYQYYFVGKRSALDTEHSGWTEYVFDVTSDRKTMFAVSVFLLPEAAADWARIHSRTLTDTEQYAAAKMRLFKGFDEVNDMRAAGRTLEVEKSNIEVLLEPLELG